MSHITDLQCSMYVDGALLASEVAQLEQHIGACVICQSRIEEFNFQKKIIEATMKEDDLIVIPNFQKPVSSKEIIISTVLTGMIALLAQLLWTSFYSEPLAQIVSWFTSFNISGGFALVVDTILYIYQEGTTMLNTMVNFSIFGLSIAVMIWFIIHKRSSPAMLNLCLVTFIGSSFFISPSSYAVDFRHSDDMINIESGEIINDTLIIAGEAAIIDGDINGDLIVLGRRVVVNGTVDGNVISLSKAVTINGQISGSFLGAGSSIELTNANIDGDFWGLADYINVNNQSKISRNFTIVSDLASIAGSIGRDLSGAGEDLELNGVVGNNVDAFWENISLRENARIGGDVRLRADNKDHLKQSSLAVIEGKIDVVPFHTEHHAKNHYLTLDFYIFQLVRFISALIMGIALFWIVPSMRDLNLSGGIAGIKTAGIGLLSLISLPIMMFLFAVTVVGIPLTLITLFSWIVMLYFAKIVLALLIGRMAFKSSDKNNGIVKTLLAGLLIILIAINIPFIGGMFNFVLTIIGVGLIVQHIFTYVSNLNTAH